MISGNIILVSLDLKEICEVEPEIAERMTQARERKIQARHARATSTESQLDFEKIIWKNPDFMVKRIHAVDEFKTLDNTPYPPPPMVPKYHGPLLNKWKEMTEYVLK